MTYSIEIDKSALKYLQKLDKKMRTRIIQHLQILAEDPFHPELDIKRMQGTFQDFRLRVGSYRVVYTVEEEILVIHVIKIGSRGDVYKT
ncbi:type II toxin-antitoxin system RelE/ParE family toxin [Paenibacillus sp. YYML68]|uniref:type II toxin-antitoxin system RelE family toxin n=1 Tax=Paenibacillus sp. YYML68 TaxID=2909250 RepID=UPI00248F9CBE|nr:type II toxin-antitoxin system RelE/ParE family toxin [Paenibacillus sp. YYML68]